MLSEIEIITKNIQLLKANDFNIPVGWFNNILYTKLSEKKKILFIFLLWVRTLSNNYFGNRFSNNHISQPKLQH